MSWQGTGGGARNRQKMAKTDFFGGGLERKLIWKGVGWENWSEVQRQFPDNFLCAVVPSVKSVVGSSTAYSLIADSNPPSFFVSRRVTWDTVDTPQLVSFSFKIAWRRSWSFLV